MQVTLLPDGQDPVELEPVLSTIIEDHCEHPNLDVFQMAGCVDEFLGITCY